MDNWTPDAKTLEWAAKNGWVSPPECHDCLKHHDQEVALNERSCMAAEGWSEPGAIEQARADTRLLKQGVSPWGIE